MDEDWAVLVHFVRYLQPYVVFEVTIMMIVKIGKLNMLYVFGEGISLFAYLNKL